MHRANEITLRRLSVVAAVCAALGLASVSCKTPNDPSQLVTDVRAINSCGAAVDVFLDGTKQFSLDDGYYQTIQGVSQGSHQFAAKKKGTEVLVASTTIMIYALQVYEFDIVGPSSIKVINAFGETIRISLDGTQKVNLEKDASYSLTGITFGVHGLSAAKDSDGTVVASTNIDVQEVKEYTWTIDQ
jgi:hypothetical protein